ncbi:MAG: DegT/DnrJ/EryC1/StrS family aminotransferase [Rhodospirillaceae bacterium]|nr:DegT/DnrJ/EryC1/StrS family aminotransferase [Rhodospirillales bacterium]
MRSVPYVNLATQWAEERHVLAPAVEAALASGQWVGGPLVEQFEQAAETYCGVAHIIGVASGTDALILSLRALDIGPGDEVITPPNSFVASTAAIIFAGATPVFADVLPDQNMDPAAIERAITPRTKAIMPVHLTGRIAAMDAIMEIAGRHGLAVIEDAAQAMGARLNGRSAGAIGTVGCFSAHPLKNLNAMGDAGFVGTNDDALAARLRRLRNNGLMDRNTVVEWGVVSRLDNVQAAVLLHRLTGLDDVVAKRRHNAARYTERLNPAFVFVPPTEPGQFNAFHTFVVQVDRRDELQAYLTAKGIGTAIHYPIPIHLQPAAHSLGHGAGSFPVTEAQASRILSLPINQFLTDADIDTVADAINGFYA